MRNVLPFGIVVVLGVLIGAPSWGCNETFRRVSWRNYAGTVVNRPRSIESPATTEEVAAVVRSAAERGLRVRPVATGHSWSQATQTNDVQLSTLKLNRVLKITPPARPGDPYLVTAQTGARLIDISRELEKHGLVFSNLGSMQFQTLGGVLSTNTHGTGVDKPGFVGAVESFKLVDGAGKIHHVSRTENPDFFRAALGGIGMLGVIPEATIKVVPKFNIEVKTNVHDLADLTAPVRGSDGQPTTKLQQLITENEWYQFVWLARTNTVISQSGRRTDAPARPGPAPELMDYLGREWVVRPMTHLMSFFRTPITSAMPLIARAASGLVDGKTTVQQNVHAFTSRIHPSDWAWQRETEFFLPRRYADAALLRLQKLFKELHDEGVDSPAPFVGMRFVKGDDSFLSPAYKVGSHDQFVAITVYDTADQRSGILRRVNEALAELVPGEPHLLRTHLGKIQHDTPDTFRSRFVDWERFQAARRRADPNGTFLNDWTRTLVEP